MATLRVLKDMAPAHYVQHAAGVVQWRGVGPWERHGGALGLAFPHLLAEPPPHSGRLPLEDGNRECSPAASLCAASARRQCSMRTAGEARPWLCLNPLLCRTRNGQWSRMSSDPLPHVCAPPQKGLPAHTHTHTHTHAGSGSGEAPYRDPSRHQRQRRSSSGLYDLSFSSWRLRRPLGAMDPCGPPSLILFSPPPPTHTHLCPFDVVWHPHTLDRPHCLARHGRNGPLIPWDEGHILYHVGPAHTP